MTHKSRLSSIQCLPLLLIIFGSIILIFSHQTLNNNSFLLGLSDEDGDDGIHMEVNDHRRIDGISLVNNHTNPEVETVTEEDKKVSRNHTEISKPLLVLHVGIMKTGTTYIQLDLLRKKRWNRVYKKLQLDGYEVITAEYPPVKFETIIKECLHEEKESGDCEPWQELIDMYTDAHTWNQKKNIIQVLESFSIIQKPFNDYTKKLLVSLKEKYDVRIVVFYRRVHEWLDSLYTQYRKPFMCRAGGVEDWRYDWRNIDEVKLLPDWLESLIESNQLHYTLPTVLEFEKLFGEEHVKVLDYHADHGLEVEFICNGIPNATEACKEAKLIAQEHRDNPDKVKRQNTGRLHAHLIDHDFLVSEAYRRKFLNQKRHTATLILEKKLKEMNMTIHQFPKKCLSQGQLNWLNELGQVTETSYSSKPFTVDEYASYATKYANRLCSIDSKKVLEDKAWVDIFRSCEFKLHGCKK